MRLVLFYDLPTETSFDRKEMNRFRKYLIKSGFIMLQESVYSKLLLNSICLKLTKQDISKNKPQKGSVMILELTEKQYAAIDYFVGNNESQIVNSIDRMSII